MKFNQFTKLFGQIFRRDQFSLKKFVRWFLIVFAAWIIIYGVYFYLSLPDVSYLKNQNPKITALMQERIDKAAAKGKKLRVRQSWVSFKNIPRLLRQAVRISEDASFYQHEGVDFVEIKESFKKNWETGKISRGASTITQQLAKNLFLSTEKSYSRKIKEYFIAGRLEDNLSKNRIYHLYLNIIELGPGVFGVQAASRIYFRKNVSRLTLEEMIRIAAIIPRPLITRPTSNSRWLKWKSRWILGKMKLYGYIEAEQYEETIQLFK